MAEHSISSPIVIFDGTCGFCSRAVLFVLRHDARGELLFASNSSPYGSALLKKYGLLDVSDRTIVVFNGDRVMLRSDAALFIASHLKPPYSWLVATRIVPRVVRDAVYRLVASVRHYLASPQDVCELLPPEQLTRIIEK